MVWSAITTSRPGPEEFDREPGRELGRELELEGLPERLPESGGGTEGEMLFGSLDSTEVGIATSGCATLDELRPTIDRKGLYE